MSFGLADETAQYTFARPLTGTSKKDSRPSTSNANPGRPSAIPRPSLIYTRPPMKVLDEPSPLEKEHFQLRS